MSEDPIKQAEAPLSVAETSCIISTPPSASALFNPHGTVSVWWDVDLSEF